MLSIDLPKPEVDLVVGGLYGVAAVDDVPPHLHKRTRRYVRQRLMIMFHDKISLQISQSYWLPDLSKQRNYYQFNCYNYFYKNSKMVKILPRY